MKATRKGYTYLKIISDKVQWELNDLQIRTQEPPPTPAPLYFWLKKKRIEFESVKAYIWNDKCKTDLEKKYVLCLDPKATNF